MKKMLSVYLAVSLLVIATTAFAGSSGGAIMPGVHTHWESSSHATYTSAYITNISGSEVTCNVFWFDHDGTDVSSYLKVYTGNTSGLNEITVVTGSGDFTLPAGASRRVIFAHGPTQQQFMGHAVIKWTSTNDSLRQALIGTGRVVEANNQSNRVQHAWSVPINDNKPF